MSDNIRLPIKKQTILRTYAFISLILSLLSLVYYLSTSSDAPRAALLSLSWAQLAVASVLGISSILLLVLLVLSIRKHAGSRIELALTNWLNEPGKPTLSLALVLSGFVFGAILLVSAYGLGETALDYHFSWLRPFCWWLTLQSVATLVMLLLWGKGALWAKPGAILLLILILLAGIVFHISIEKTASYLSREGYREDVYFTYIEGERLAAGENPYERVLGGNMRENDKYATYLPVFFYLSVVVHALGFEDFAQWLGFWRPIFLLCNLGIATLLYYEFWRQNRLLLAIFASLFWLFNRWTINVSRSADIDFLPLFLLVLSLFLFSRHRTYSLLVFGLSLAVKQMALFLVPLYVIWYWHTSDTRNLRAIVNAVLLICIIPALASLPFLVWNWEGFIKSILFSATRNPLAPPGIESIDARLGWIGIPAKAPLLLLMLAIYLSSLRRRHPPFVSSLLVMATFVYFNSVFFVAYIVWLIPFIPLAASEAIGPRGRKTIGQIRADPKERPR